MVARTTDTVREICRLQNVRGESAKTLGDLLTATVLFRETMSPGLRVQGILRGSKNGGTIVIDSAPEGKTRGLVQNPSGAPIQARSGALLQMMRTLHNGSINQGVVQMPDGGDVTQAVMAYMSESEQVDTMLAVGTVLDSEGNVASSGGYMVQLLPEVGKGPLAVMTLRLEDFRNIDRFLVSDYTPELLRDELLWGMETTPLDRSDIRFHCGCSESRLLGALATIDKRDIEEMVADGKPLDIRCDYCTKDYVLSSESLRGLLASN
jgi:molecular chaperone Hsp33